MQGFRRSLVALLVAALIPAAAFTMYQIVRITEDAQSDVEADTRGRADDMLGLANARISADLSILQTLTQSTALDDGRYLVFREMARRIAEQNRGWLQVVVVDAETDMQVMNLLRPPSDMPMPAVADSSYRQVKQRLEPAIGGVFEAIGGVADTVIPIRAPVIRNGKLRYILSVGVSTAIFQDILVSKLPATGVSAAGIVDREGRFIARSRDPGQWVGKPATQYVRDAIARSSGGIYLGRTHEGQENYTVFNTSPFTGWSVHIALDAATFDTPRSRSYLLAALAGFVCLSLAGVLVVLIAQGRAEQRRAEAAMHQMQRLEALGKMTGGLAHDFNNLLAIIVGNVELMRRRLGRELPPQVERISQAAERGEKLVRQMLAFARRQPLSPRTVDPATQIRGLADIFHRAVRGDTTIEMQLPEDVWPIEVDPVQLESALLNLVLNARDAMPDGGTLRISARNRPASGTQRGDFVEIAVADTGVGIAPENLPHVFDPFFTTKPPGMGTGLGLSMVHGFAGQSGGTAEIASSVGRGTTVRLLLPRAARPPEAVASASPAAAHAPGEGRRILVVEDNGELREMTVQLLHDVGYAVRHAASAAEALQVLESFPADLIFSDVLMPGGINGIEFAREARRRRPEVAVLLTTGDAGALSAAERSEFPILQKPYRIDVLTDSIATMLTRKDAGAASAIAK